MKPLLSVCTGIVLALLATEGFLRLCGCARLPIGIPGTSGIARSRENPENYYRFYINSEGYRTAEIRKNKAKNEIRILVVGDSHTEGAGVADDKRFSRRFEDCLNGHMDHKLFTVINFGRHGSTLQDYLNIIRDGLDYEPDIILVVIFSGNDLVELMSPLRWRQGHVEHTSTVDKGVGSRLLKEVKKHLRRLYVYHLTAYAVKGVSSKRQSEVTKTGPYLQALGQAKYFIEKPESLEPALHRFRSSLQAIRRQAERSKNRKLVVVTLPSKLQIDPDILQTGGKGVAEQLQVEFDHARRVDSSIHSSVSHIARELVCHAADLRDELKETRPSEQKFWPGDWHLNNLGHEIVAKVLCEYYLSGVAGGGQ